VKLIEDPFPIVCQHHLDEGNEHGYEDGQYPYGYVSLNNRISDSGKEDRRADKNDSGEARIVLFQERRKKECSHDGSAEKNDKGDGYDLSQYHCKFPKVLMK